jgi:hypothetical protein
LCCQSGAKNAGNGITDPRRTKPDPSPCSPALSVDVVALAPVETRTLAHAATTEGPVRARLRAEEALVAGLALALPAHVVAGAVAWIRVAQFKNFCIASFMSIGEPL